ncbi:MAG: tRNA (N(6)-L-threonylcarbamoyladenosine(37)-C(2))-methylthiotransferase MtaB [bacterium]
MKRVAFCTFGCRLNQYDTEAMRTLLVDEGDWRAVPWSDEADVYVVNTCSVTSRADARARTMIRRIHAERPEARIVATGCYAQRAPEDFEKLPVSLVLGAADRERAVEEFAGLSTLVPGRIRLAVSPIEEARAFHEVPITEMMDRSRAFVKVQEGCNESCTFCIVPATRGRSRSRRPEKVLAQVRELIHGGYSEIVITGVHVGDYGLDLEEERRLLPELVESILAMDGLHRFRLSSIEPASIGSDLISLMAGEEKFARHFHIPMQSASDSVLERMKRRYSADEFCDLLQRIGEEVPDCGLGTDVICGFPGESDEDFQATFDAIERLPITYLHAFSYSERPGSEAIGMEGAVPGDVRKRRTGALRKLGADKNLAFRRRLVGREARVFVEAARRDGEPWLTGLTDNYLRVDLGPGEVTSPLVDVRLTGTTGDALTGELLQEVTA